MSLNSKSPPKYGQAAPQEGSLGAGMGSRMAQMASALRDRMGGQPPPPGGPPPGGPPMAGPPPGGPPGMGQQMKDFSAQGRGGLANVGALARAALMKKGM